MTIFSQWEKVLLGDKWETRRVALDTDYGWGRDETLKPDPRRNGGGFPAYSSIHAESGRVKWQLEKQYPIIPKRGHFQLWHKFEDGKLLQSLQKDGAPRGMTMLEFARHLSDARHWYDDWRDVFKAKGYQPSRIEAVALHREQLHDITEADAVAEGVESVDAYRELWEQINGKTPYRWVNNPAVYVVKFKVVGGSLKDHLAALEASN